MANLKYEGEIEGISERQLEFISSVLAERGFTNTTVKITAVGKADDNFAANVKRIVVEKDGNTFKTVVKIAPTNEFVRARVNIQRLFANEHVMYKYVFPKFTELEKGADIPENERLRYPLCYGSSYEEGNEIILLEDLQLSDFVMLNKTKPYSDETVKLVLKNFAILHSLSYALKNREPDTFEEFTVKLANKWSLHLDNDTIKPLLGIMEQAAMSIIDNAKHKKLMQGAMSQLPLMAKKNYRIDKGSKYAVIQQGDCWNNNMMFRVEADKPIQCCMIDYQLSSDNSPVADLHYMLFSCTDYATRTKHYHEWIDHYHTQLDKSLSNFNLKANLIYPRDQLDADLRRFGKLSFGIAVMLANMLEANEQDAEKMKEAMKVEGDDLDDFVVPMDNVSTVTGLKARIEGLINSFLELGYL